MKVRLDGRDEASLWKRVTTALNVKKSGGVVMSWLLKAPAAHKVTKTVQNRDYGRMMWVIMFLSGLRKICILKRKTCGSLKTGLFGSWKVILSIICARTSRAYMLFCKAQKKLLFIYLHKFAAHTIFGHLGHFNLKVNRNNGLIVTYIDIHWYKVMILFDALPFSL